MEVEKTNDLILITRQDKISRLRKLVVASLDLISMWNTKCTSPLIPRVYTGLKACYGTVFAHTNLHTYVQKGLCHNIRTGPFTSFQDDFWLTSSKSFPRARHRPHFLLPQSVQRIVRLYYRCILRHGVLCDPLNSSLLWPIHINWVNK